MPLAQAPHKRLQDTDVLSDNIRKRVLTYSKDFKTSWVNLGQALYAVWQDKLYHIWGYEKFEHYTEKELGMKKSTALKLLKTYYFLEDNEPAYLKKEFAETREPVHVPGIDEINVLRLAKGKKELMKQDYDQLKRSVFDKGKDASSVRKDLVSMMKERKQVDPDEERDQRNAAAIKKLIFSIRSFEKDMEVLKILPDEVVTEAKELLSKLEEHLP